MLREAIKSQISCLRPNSKLLQGIRGTLFSDKSLCLKHVGHTGFHIFNISICVHIIYMCIYIYVYVYIYIYIHMMDFITPTPTNINVLYARQTSFVSHHSALFSQQLPHSNQVCLEKITNRLAKIQQDSPIGGVAVPVN